MSTIADLMTSVLITVKPEQTVADAERAMERGGVRHLPVLDGELLVGMLGRVDLVGRPEDAPVSGVMSGDLVTVGPTSRASDAVVAMLMHSIHALPVVADGKLVGIVTATDLLIEAYDAMRQSEITAEAARRRIDVEDTVLRAKLERVRRAHHADLKAIALSELHRFLERHFGRRGGAEGALSRLVVEKPQLSVDVAEIHEAQAQILREVERLQAANHARAIAGETLPSAATDDVIAVIEQHEQREASLLAG